MSIVRVGLAETKNFKQGYAAIFGSKKKKEEAPAEPETEAASATPADKKSAKPAKKKARK
jgi:hypothetical protein